MKNIIKIVLVLNFILLAFTGCGSFVALPNEQPVDVKENAENTESSDSVGNNDSGQETVTAEETTKSTVMVCGEEIRSNIVWLDLSKSELPDVDTLIGELSQLYRLSEVEFGERELDVADCLKLATEFPEVEFDWRICLVPGTYIDNTTTKLDIRGKKVADTKEFSDVLSLFPNLTYLDMCRCGLTNEEMEVLRDTYPNIKFVWEITFGTWTIRTDRVAFSTLKGKTESYYLKSEDVECLKYCTDMVALDLGHNSIGDVSFLKYMPNLKILILVDNLDPKTGKYITDLSVLKYCPKLEYLEFFVGNVSDLSFLEHLPNLKDLNLSYNPVKDVTYLLDLPSIERLFFEHTYLTAEDYELLQKTYPDAHVVMYGEGSVDNGWREHPRYFAMKDMYYKDYVHEIFAD